MGGALKADRALSHIPIVALSAHAMRTHEERAMESGCDAFLTKPIDETLYRTLAHILATDKPVVLVVDDEPLNATSSSRSSTLRVTPRCRDGAPTR
jgi:DNA-binding response OmpR family regulator